MRKIITLMALMIVAVFATNAQVTITKVDKVVPTDQIFMDMAVTAGGKSLAAGNVPCGAVVILNNAWRSTGIPGDNITAEENAIAKSRLSNLANATIYTIVEPTTEVYNTINSLGANAIYFVVGRDQAVALGIYPASAYDESKVAEGASVPMKQMAFDEATQLVAKYKK